MATADRNSGTHVNANYRGLPARWREPVLWSSGTDRSHRYGSGGTAIVATNDSATVNSPYTGVVVANVLANDVLADGPATTGNVTLTQLTSTNAAITLNTANGAVSVASGVRVGVETLTYRICETARLSNCAPASVTVTMAGNRVDANDDTGASKTGGGTALANVLANDTFVGGAAALTNVTIRKNSADAVLSLQPSGAMIVSAGASVGPHRLTYQICETGNPSNCPRPSSPCVSQRIRLTR